MPASKPTLDLEAWSSFAPQERTNDYEYNVLLYKFKSLFNEVKDFHSLHNDCSVTRATRTSKTEPPVFSTSDSSDKLSGLGLAHHANNINSNTAIDKIPMSNKPSLSSVLTQQTSSVQDKRTFFQQQNSFPLNGNKLAGPRDFFLKKQSDNLTQSTTHQDQVSGSVQHLFNSSYNLSSPSNPMSKSRPEIRSRGTLSNQRLSMSKSSERLDAINNNHLSKAPNSRLPQGLNRLELNKIQLEPNQIANLSESEANIYDAVSPDDLPKASENENCTIDDTSTPNVAASIHNLNKLSMSNDPQLESSKSTLGLRSNTEIPRVKLNLASRSTPIWKSMESRQPSNSFNSTANLEQTNNSSSSLSLVNSTQGSRDMNASDFANYVNIDFFLRRAESPSFENLDEADLNRDAHHSDENYLNQDSDSSGSGEDTTQQSNSLSSDQNCDDPTKDISPRHLINRFNNMTNQDTSTSVTPSSSDDIQDETRNLNAPPVAYPPPPAQVLDAAKVHTSSLPTKSDYRGNQSAKEIINKNSSTRSNLMSIKESGSNLALSTFSDSFKSTISDNDDNAFVEAQNTMRTFLSDLNLSPVNDIFEDKAQRRIVKESFAVECCGRRKLRHLFLFNDVIVCAKYQASSKQKFTFDVKWYLNLNGISILDVNDASNQLKYDKETFENQILSIRTHLMMLRGQMQQVKKNKEKQSAKVMKKLKKKRTELEAELVLLLPHLPLVIKHQNGKRHTFYLSSNFDRNQWVESIRFLQSQLPNTKNTSSDSPSSSELQAWIQTCRKNLNPSLGTFLLRSNCDDDLLYGDLYIKLSSINGLSKPGNYYFCFEVDSYGHFSQKASSAILSIKNSEHDLNEDYIFPLDGAHTLRILLYEDLGVSYKPSVIGKAHVELSRSWFLEKPTDKTITFSSNCSIQTQLSYSSSELLSMRIPHSKLCPTFGMDITQVCKKEKTTVPLLIQLCVNEVERRGMKEVGIYRMSGTSTDIQRLKKAFETNPYAAELLLRDIDINSVTGFLKTYLREMPEGLFSNKLHSKFVAAFNMPQTETAERTKKMLDLFHMIPSTNQNTIIYLVEHLNRVYRFENYNKMSLTNLATVLGPNIFKPPAADSPGAESTADPFTAVVIGSMSQAGILYFFLNRKFSNLPLTELDSSELRRSFETR